jgi:hypothetical protein
MLPENSATATYLYGPSRTFESNRVCSPGQLLAILLQRSIAGHRAALRPRCRRLTLGVVAVSNGTAVRVISHINASFCTNSSVESFELESIVQHRRRRSKSLLSSSLAKIVDPRPTEYCPRRRRVFDHNAEKTAAPEGAGKRTK